MAGGRGALYSSHYTVYLTTPYKHQHLDSLCLHHSNPDHSLTRNAGIPQLPSSTSWLCCSAQLLQYGHNPGTPRNAVYRVHRWSSAGASQRPVRNVGRERSSAMAMTLAKPVNYGAPPACTGISLDRAKNDIKTSMSPIMIPLCPVKPTRLKTTHELNPPAPASRQAGEIRR